MLKKEKQVNKRKKFLIVTLITIALLIVIIGISYAFWQKTKVQNDKNVIGTACFDITLDGENPINLASVYPMTNKDGMATTPYTFTITNICQNPTYYDISLESLSGTTFQNSSIKVALENEIKLYSEYEEGSLYFEESKATKILTTGVLNNGDSKTFNLRLWIDENAPTTEQNKVFESKIIVHGNLEPKTDPINKVEIGDYISMTPTSTSYTIPASLTGYSSDQTINPSELNLWRVIRKNEDGTIEAVSEYVPSTQVYFKGQTGYLNYVGTLNVIAAQYTNEKYVQSTRHMGYNSQTEYCTELSLCPEDTEYETDTNLVQEGMGTLIAKNLNNVSSEYFLASRQTYFNQTAKYYRGRSVNNDSNLNYIGLYRSWSENASYEGGSVIRPIITIKSSVQIVSGDGKSADTTYQLF